MPLVDVHYKPQGTLKKIFLKKIMTWQDRKKVGGIKVYTDSKIFFNQEKIFFGGDRIEEGGHTSTIRLI